MVLLRAGGKERRGAAVHEVQSFGYAGCIGPRDPDHTAHSAPCCVVHVQVAVRVDVTLNVLTTISK